MRFGDSFTDVKVGDQVAFRDYGDWVVSTVEKVTPTRFVVRGYAFHKNNGRLVGGEIWSKQAVARLDESMLNLMAQQKREKERNQAVNVLRQFPWADLPLEDLQKILKEAVEAHEAVKAGK